MDLTYTTDRLILKVLTADEAKSVLQFYLDNREVFEKYEPDRPQNFYTETYQKAVLLYEYNLAVKLSAVRFYVYRREQPNKIIGTIGFRNITRSVYQNCEVGYKFDANFWHQGYAFEALCLGIAVMFEDLHLHRIEANVMPDNHASIRLLENLGFTQEGIAHSLAYIHGDWQDHLRFGLVAGNAAPKLTRAPQGFFLS